MESKSAKPSQVTSDGNAELRLGSQARIINIASGALENPCLTAGKV